MLLLRLDMVAVVHLYGEAVGKDHRSRNRQPRLEIAHLEPGDAGHMLTLSRSVTNYGQMVATPQATVVTSHYDSCNDQPNFVEIIETLEEEIAKLGQVKKQTKKKERTMIVHVGDRRSTFSEEVLEEIQMLADSSSLEIVSVTNQFRSKHEKGQLLGKGKLADLLVQAICLQVDILLFSCDLSPLQVKQLSAATDLKIIDRTQLILDIFARRAHSRGAKLQVELAQMKYLLPRLSHQGTDMSRLMGGIGGRGPGETKLEIDRRRARERIARLEKELKQFSDIRGRTRSLRKRRGVPVVALVGYTNVGKSTLFNKVTDSDVPAADAAFVTLAQTTRRLRLPSGRQVVLLDTVGFMRDLPADLLTAFRATLEEIHEANLFLHVMDASHPDLFFQMESVERILDDMELIDVPQIKVLNKADLLAPLRAKVIEKRIGGVAVSATTELSVDRLLTLIDERLEEEFPLNDSLAYRKVAPHDNN